MTSRTSTARFLSCADAALTVEFGDAIDPALQARVLALDSAVQVAHLHGTLAGVIETVPSFRSLTLLYDPLQTSRAVLRQQLEALLDAPQPPSSRTTRRWHLPVCYAPFPDSDLDAISAVRGLSRDAIIDLHSGREYVVYMLGFLPGFPFMGDVAKPLQLPRRTEPRVRVPAGSVAIATGLTAVYPWESPGGWHLLGRCAVPLFNPDRPAPALLQAGDRVRFEPVSEAQYQQQWLDYRHGTLDPFSLCNATAAEDA